MPAQIAIYEETFVFYQTRILRALSELGYTTDINESRKLLLEDSIRSKMNWGKRPRTGALVYLLVQIESNIDKDPETWAPIARKAIATASGWVSKEDAESTGIQYFLDRLVAATKGKI